MKNLEQALMQTDFSKYTDLKSRLAGKLFAQKHSQTVSSFGLHKLSNEEVELVNAAQGLSDQNPFALPISEDPNS